MGENKAASSIARKINMDFFFQQLRIFLLLDILLLFLLCFCFMVWQEEKIGEEQNVTKRTFERHGRSGKAWREYDYVLYTDDGDRYVVYMTPYLAFVRYPIYALLAAEGLCLVSRLFKTREIRRRMRPLNEMARHAEELSRLSFDSHSKFISLENAISNMKPDDKELKVATGDKELRNLEIAINRLLEKMRDTYKQQNRFVSDASHELRTPIAVIQGYVNMLDRWGKEDESVLEESIEALKNESQHMKELVEQLLFLARGDSKKNTLNIEEINLTDIVREVYEESIIIDEKHKYCFYCFEGEENIKIMGDAAMVKQSVRIFADNAAKYSREGGVIAFKVGFWQDKVFYYVQDEGMGMAEGEVVHVFERFYRSDSARNGKTGGTGLGLSIAKWITDAHDGEIEVLSRPEIGTRFTVKFPKIEGKKP